MLETLRRDCELILEFHTLSLAASLVGVASARVVDENATHDVSGEAYEMFAAVPVDVLFYEAKVSLIDEGGRLQRMVGALAPHVGIGDAMKL